MACEKFGGRPASEHGFGSRPKRARAVAVDDGYSTGRFSRITEYSLMGQIETHT